MWSPSFLRASRSSWRQRERRAGLMSPRTAAVTFTVLQALSLGGARGSLLARARTKRGLAFAALGGATLRLLRGRLDSRARRGRRWSLRARRALREPVEAALAAAMLGALSLPLMVEPPPEPHEKAPVPPGGTRAAGARSEADDGDDGDDLDLNGAIASW